MHKTVMAKKAKFYVVFLSLSAESRKHYSEKLADLDIPFIDCVHPADGSPEILVPGNKHPNEKVHTFWSRCIAEELEKELPEAALNSPRQIAKKE